MCLTLLNSTMLNQGMRRKKTCSYLERKIASTVCWGIFHLNQRTLFNISTAPTAQHKGSMYRYTAHTEHAMQPPRCLLSYCLQEEKWSQVKWNDLDTIMFNMVAQVKHMGGGWGYLRCRGQCLSICKRPSLSASSVGDETHRTLQWMWSFE